MSVGPPKITKLYKTLQIIDGKTVKEASAVSQSFLDGVVIFFVIFGGPTDRQTDRPRY